MRAATPGTASAGARSPRGHRALVLLVAVTALMVVAVLISPPGGGRAAADPGHRPLFLGLVAAAVAALVLARWRSVASLAVTTALGLLALVLTGGIGPLAVAVCASAFLVSLRTDRRTAVLAAVPAGLLLGLVGALAGAGSVFRPEYLGLLAWIGMSVAVGDALRVRRAYVAAIIERAERAEASREEETRRRVAEERLRIARELHDVVAHHISVANVQAGVADLLLRTDPDGAAAALAHVRQSSRSVLEELGALLSVLRGGEDGEPVDEPAPGLDRLEALVGSFAAAGLDVRWGHTGVPGPVGSAVDLTAYRIVQEGLTNAHKHGAGTARLNLVWAPDTLRVEMTNPLPDGGPPAATAGGHGLLGMRERAHAVGGTLRAGPRPGATFAVVADLPLGGHR